MKRRGAGSPQRTLRDQSKSTLPLEPLPLVHVTTVGHGREIIRGGKIEPNDCKVFKRNLVYMFVGRPDYKVKGGDQKQEYISHFPIAFVFEPSAAATPFHVFPFDTGGAANGAFSDLADEYVFLEDYELDQTLDAALRHIAWLFDNGRDYFDGNVRPELQSKTPAFDTTTKSFLRIAGMASDASNRPDRRASAVEIAIRTSLPLRDHLKLIVAPAQMLHDMGQTDQNLLNVLNSIGAEVVLYDWVPNESPDHYLSIVRSIIRERTITRL